MAPNMAMGSQMIGPQMAMMPPPAPPGMDPASNNQPLQFNMNKGKTLQIFLIVPFVRLIFSARSIE